MKIAIIDPVGGHGGMDYYDYGLNWGLHENKVEVHYFTCTKTKELIPNCSTLHHSFDTMWDKGKLLKIYFLLRGYLRAFRFSKQNNIQIAHFQFFHLGIQNVFVLFIAKVFGLKRVVTLHDIDSFKKNELGLLKKIGLRLAQVIIVHNAFSKNELKNKNVTENKVQVIPHGNYLPFVKTLTYKKPELPLKLLFFGQIKEVKGLDILIDAVSKVNKEVQKVHLTIAGRPWGIDKSTIEKQIRELKLESSIETHFNYIPNEEVTTYFEKSDIVVLPYKRIYQSGVLLLSMSYGRVTLSSDLLAFSEIINHNENGFLFKSENSSDLALQIEKIAANKDVISEIRTNALNDLTNEFSWINIGSKTKEVYNKLI